jgi:hypothetical protein
MPALNGVVETALYVDDMDRARERNGEGFNKLDGDFGHSLAEQERPLSPKQAEFGLKLVRKYRRQLSEDLLEAAGVC